MKKLIKINNPVFFCIGAQKSGTSWLYYQLQSLEGFNMPYIKELHYFDRSKKYPSPSKWSKSLLQRILNYKLLKNATFEILSAIYRLNIKKMKWMIKWHFSNINNKWYSSLFNNLNGISGDMTPAYSILEIEDVKKIYLLYPNAKIIFILRNPIDRAISHLHFYYKSRNISIEKLSDQEIKKFIDDNNQDLRSNYIRTIKNYSEVFPNKNILIGFYDAIIDQPYDFLIDIIDFLGEKKSKLNYDNIKQKINTSKKTILSSDVKDYITQKYAPMIKQLSLQFGGYCKKWEQQINNKKTKNRKFPASIRI